MANKQKKKVLTEQHPDDISRIAEGRYGRIRLDHAEKGVKSVGKRHGYLLSGVEGKTTQFPANQDWINALRSINGWCNAKTKHWFIVLEGNESAVNKVVTEILNDSIKQFSDYKQEMKKLYYKRHYKTATQERVAKS